VVRARGRPANEFFAAEIMSSGKMLTISGADRLGLAPAPADCTRYS
jgi:hypothetical protein